MLATFWEKLSYSGINNKLRSSDMRYVVLVNRIGMIAGIIFLLSFILNIIEKQRSELIFTHYLLLVSGVIFFGVTMLNRLGYFQLAKLTICWLPAIILLYISITSKLTQPEVITVKDFFSYRFFLMATTIIPILIFSTRRLPMLLFHLIPSFVGTVFYDLIHMPFGVNFTQFGYWDPYNYIIDIMVGFAYLAFVGFLLNQRMVSDRFENELQEKQDKLREKNKELSHKNAFINEQNYEMNAQSEKLMESHEALLEAHHTIEQQKKLLERQNLTLEAQVREKTIDLSMVNEELLIRNNELRQFSHTLSHNLKSPVATFQGLLNLIDVNDLNDSNKELLRYLNESVNKMQEVFSDMNEMLEIRNKLYNSVEEVNLQEMMDGLHNDFYPELSRNNIRFRYNFNGLQSIRTNERQINSILFHLISNSIKFRSEKRSSEIDIQMKANGVYNSFIVRDNGVGINMEKYAEKLFFPYQKFHHQTSGKGLGLYIVKLQTESLGGTISLKSEPDSFTEIEVKLRK
jgi:signal transduction histidine kinase